MAHELVHITANGTKLRVRTEEVVDEVPDSRLGSWPVLMDAARAASRAGRSSLWRAVRGINCEPRTETYKVNELMRKIEWTLASEEEELKAKHEAREKLGYTPRPRVSASSAFQDLD